MDSKCWVIDKVVASNPVVCYRSAGGSDGLKMLGHGQSSSKQLSCLLSQCWWVRWAQNVGSSTKFKFDDINYSIIVS